MLRELSIEAEDNGSRLFSVLPLCKFETKHVTVNPTNMMGVLQRLHRDFPDDYNDINFNNVTNVEAFYVNNPNIWSDYCDVAKVTTSTWTFAKNFTTDGYAVSVLRRKPLPPNPNPNPNPNANGQGNNDVVIQGRRIVAIDPNKRYHSFFSLVRGHKHDRYDKANQRAWGFSSKTYNNIVKTKEARNKRIRWREHAELTQALELLPTGKTGVAATFIEHVEAKLALKRRWLAMNSQTKVHSLRFSQYGRRQKGLNQIIECMTKGGGFQNDRRPVILAIGHSNFQCMLPLQSLKRALVSRGNKVVIINEHCTSMLCSCCHQEMPEVAMRGVITPRNVRKCPTAFCGIMWHRDVNACINILHLMVEQYAVGGNGRPSIVFEYLNT